MTGIPRSRFEARGIVKDFPGVRAVDHVDFDAYAGEIHAIVGANGAGKSTLCKIFSGVYRADSGQIMINGQQVHIDSPSTAKALGIAIAPQEVDTALVPYLTVAENIALSRLARQKAVRVNWSQMYSDTEKVAEDVKLGISVRTPVSRLSIHQRQKVVIAQALFANARFLILDEPTGSLSLREVDQLFALLRGLIEKFNLCVIYISHRMPEVFDIADRISVMRDGKMVGTVRPDHSSIDEVVFMMLNRRRSALRRIPRAHPPDRDSAVVLNVEGLRRGRLVNNVTFEVREREILGVAGLVGAGKTEVARILFGADKPESGRVYVNGEQVRLNSPADAMKHGICLVPEDRRQEGIFIEFPVVQNITLPNLSRFCKAGFIQAKEERRVASGIVERLGIICRDLKQKVKFLSGGNQQKVSIGKWLVGPGSVFIFDEPTKGVDVGAKEEIFRIVAGLADAGASVIYCSAELEEVLRISDRILVMYEGHVVSEFDADAVDEEQLLLYASGGGKSRIHRTAETS